MARVSIKFVVSFSSQDDHHKVSSIVDSNGFNYWLSHPKEKSGQIEAIFQLEKECLITSIDVGSVWCANMELQVGRSDWVQGVEYKTLLPTVCLTSPIECRNGEGTLKNRTFFSEHFCADVSKRKWDRIKVICRQPFRKDVQFGLTYIRVKSATPSPRDNTNILQPSTTGSDKATEDTSVVTSIQKHFFGRIFLNNKERIDPLQSKLLKIAGTAENGVEHEIALPRTAKLVLAATESLGKYSPQSRAKTNSSVKGQLFSESLVHKYGPKFEEEVTEYLKTLQLEDFDLDNITIADLRHRFEKSQKRKLNGDEKRIFMELCQNYICDLFDKLDSKTSELPSNLEHEIENEIYCNTSTKKRKANGDTNLSSPKYSKFGMNGIGKLQAEQSTTSSKTDSLSYRSTPVKTFSDLSNKLLIINRKSASTTGEKQTSTVESCNGKIDTNHKVTPSKSKVMKPLTFLSPTNHKQSSIIVRENSLLKNKDASSNYLHQTDSAMSASIKNNSDHSHIQSLVAAIKNNFPNSSHSPVRKLVNKEVSNTQKSKAQHCTNTEQDATKRFPYRGLQLEIGSVNSRTKSAPINKLVSDIHSSAYGSKNEWLSKEKGLRCNGVLTNDHLGSPVSRVTGGHGKPMKGAPTARSRGEKSGTGSTRSRGGSTRQMREVSNERKQKKDDWSEADFDLSFAEDTNDNSDFPNYVLCSTCKGNVPEHLYSDHYLTCCRGLSSTSPSRGLLSSSVLTSSSPTAHSSQVSHDDKCWTVLSSSDSDSDPDVSVKHNDKCVSCPICEQMFPEDVIMTHANFCCETIGFN